MLSGTGDVRHEFMCAERLKDEVEQLLKLSFSMFTQLLHYVSTHASSVAQIQVIIFDSHYSLVDQSDRSEVLLIPYLFHNCTCILFSLTYNSMLHLNNINASPLIWQLFINRASTSWLQWRSCNLGAAYCDRHPQ